jgi:hypothetical protein
MTLLSNSCSKLQSYSNFTAVIPKQHKEQKGPFPTGNASNQSS